MNSKMYLSIYSICIINLWLHVSAIKQIVVLKSTTNWQTHVSRLSMAFWRGTNLSATAADKIAWLKIKFDINELKSILDQEGRMYIADFPEELWLKLQDHADVEYIESIQRFRIRQQTDTIISEDSVPNWALDRIDTRAREFNDQFQYPETAGQDVAIYVLDTGVDVYHPEFLAVGSTNCSTVRVQFGKSFLSNTENTDILDPNGHGTFVAALAIGRTVGVAKRANVIAVQVLDANGEGTSDQILAGLDWTMEHIIQTNRTFGRSIINLSFGASYSRSLNRVVNDITKKGIPVVVAAGNDAKSACTDSPASARHVITVGATNEEDELASFSNRGTCIDILAPGQQVVSASLSDPQSHETCSNLQSKTTTDSGTSFSSPLTAGVLALYMAQQPNRYPLDSEFSQNWKQLLIREHSTPDIISGLKFTQTPNYFLYSMPPNLNSNSTSSRNS